MRFSLGFALALAAVGARAQTSPADALRRALHDTTLENGLTVVAVENHAVPLVTIDITFKTGAFTQEPGDEGVPHLFEHMLFKSYIDDSRATWPMEAGRLDAEYNGTTSDERVNYWVLLPSSNFDDAMGDVAQLVRDPIFTQDNLSAERLVVFDEFNRDASNPMYLIERAVDERLWTTSWGRKNPLGEAQSISAANTKRLNDIFHRYYVPNNAVVAVSGDVTPAQVFKSARTHFGHWRRAADPFVTPVPAIAALPRSAGVIMEGDVRDVVLVLKWQGPSVTDPDQRQDTYAADVLSTILDAPGSTFQERLVDNGLFSSCSIGYLTLGHVGPIELIAHSSVDSLTPALNALVGQLMDLASGGGFTDEEITDARQERRVGAAFEMDDATAIAHTAAFWWSVAGLDYFRDYTDRLESVERPALQRYVNRYMNNRPVVAGILVPKGRSAQLKPVLAQFLDRLKVPTT
ncbi:MAG TPA: pitrilysin family protein [Gemmatimonadaceae bacterium]|nr:pitrilysin family protein [Gemmatimonadaceae bacterium]